MWVDAWLERQRLLKRGRQARYMRNRREREKGEQMAQSEVAQGALSKLRLPPADRTR
jgi:hypothetical protein